MDYLRYIPLIEADACRQMAVDEAILRCYDRASTGPTLRFFKFSPSSITLGYAQEVDEVINTKRCDELGIPYVRRITGGGTVFHDNKGEITYSIVSEKPSGAVEESFRHLLNPIIQTLKDYELDAVFKPYNDILVGGKKISGSAQRRGKRGLLQHGTLMYSTDLQTLADILKIDEEKFRSKGVDSFFDLVTTIEDELGYEIEPDELIDDMKDGYSRYLEVDIVEERLTQEEEELASRLADKYASRSWTYEREWNG